MTTNQLKITLRTLWKNRLFTTLNVVGLAIGLSAAWVVWQYSSFESNHNQQISDANRIFRVVSSFSANDKSAKNAGCPEPLSRTAETISGVEKAIPIQDLWTLSAMPEGAKKAINEPENVVKTVPAFFEMVSFKWLAGSRMSALLQPNQVVLTKKRAEIYFPRLTPDEILGKKIDYIFYGDTVISQVVGVVEELDFPSSFTGKEFISREKPKREIWSNTNSGDQLWLILDKKADPKTVIVAINELSDKNSKADLEKYKMSRSLSLQPLAEVHFDAEYSSQIRTANPQVMRVLPAVALFLLLLACINYINLSTAQIPMRAREIGVRKTLGSSRRSLVFSFLLETFLVCLLAVGIAFFLTKWAFVFFEKDLPDEVLKYANWHSTALFLIGLVAVVTLFSGLYPGWLIGRFQAVSLLKGQFSGQNQSKMSRAGLRKGLIIFQFFIAQIFIISALFVGRQLNFMLEKDLGFDREAVVVASIPYKLYQDPAYKGKEKVLAETISKLPEIEKIALGEPLFNESFSSNTNSATNEKGVKMDLPVFRKRGDAALLDFYKVPVLAGRAILLDKNDHETVLNETAINAFGFANPAAAIGQIITENRGEGAGRTIVGVVSDFHTGKFSNKIGATAFILETENRTFNIRLASRRPEDWPTALKKIEAEWSKIYPDDPMKAKFYDETMREIYGNDLAAARFVNTATGVAVLIACLGLFGLATFTALRRTKEIGVRKVLGASAASVVGLLSKEFLVLVTVGFALAVPISVYFLQKWLADYVYRVDLDWKLVAAAGFVGVSVALLTVGFQAVRAALADPVKSLRSE
jgi:putative ABC transport system permease protein